MYPPTIAVGMNGTLEVNHVVAKTQNTAETVAQFLMESYNQIVENSSRSEILSFKANVFASALIFITQIVTILGVTNGFVSTIELFGAMLLLTSAITFSVAHVFDL